VTTLVSVWVVESMRTAGIVFCNCTGGSTPSALNFRTGGLSVVCEAVSLVLGMVRVLELMLTAGVDGGGWGTGWGATDVLGSVCRQFLSAGFHSESGRSGGMVVVEYDVAVAFSGVVDDVG
jgi:hypothetical protein